MNVDEMQMARNAARGELRAATELVDRFYQPVYAFLRRLAGSESDAADLTQKTFARVWSALPRFAGRSTLSSWLHGIAGHVWQDWRRANHRLEPRSDAWWAELADDRTGPDAAVAAADEAATVYAAVDQLDPDARQAVHLHYYQGLTLEETSEALGVPTSTLKYRLRTAVQEIRSRVVEKSSATRTLNLVQRP
jgi:RNA polymerase sigma-70 factor (ECF subfamily)